MQWLAFSKPTHWVFWKKMCSPPGIIMSHDLLFQWKEKGFYCHHYTLQIKSSQSLQAQPAMFQSHRYRLLCNCGFYMPRNLGMYGAHRCQKEPPEVHWITQAPADGGSECLRVTSDRTGLILSLQSQTDFNRVIQDTKLTFDKMCNRCALMKRKMDLSVNKTTYCPVHIYMTVLTF